MAANFIDYVKIYCRSGKGGAGCMHLHRAKYLPKGGPDGGDGGKGGSIILRGNRNLWTLLHLKYQKHIMATDGGKGGQSRSFGKDGEDKIIEVPCGTVVYDGETGEYICEVKEHKEQVVLLKGGRGGLGNWHFRTATNQAPRYAQPGEPAQERTVIMQLKVLADVGLVGFPNAGKSTLLSVVSAAKPEIADYPFTTLTPKLGVVRTRDGSGYVIADIPGLIEGASEGKGAGHRFLRHIERTRLILHIVDVSPYSGRDPFDDFLKINEELRLYHERLAVRPQIVACNKTDVPGSEERLAEFREKYEKWLEEAVSNDPYVAEYAEKGCYRLFEISAAEMKGVQELSDYCGSILEYIPQESTFEDIIEDESAGVPYDGEEELFTVEMDGDVYVICGRFIEHLLDSVNLGDYESQGYFQRVLRQKGVIDKLEEMGIKEGDTVRIADTEFDFSF